MLSNFFPLLCTLHPPFSLSLFLLCCVRGQRVERMPRTLGLCDWKHIVSHFNIYDKMPVALCQALGLYLTPTDRFAKSFPQSLPHPPLSCISFIFNCVFNLRHATRASSILEHTKILRNVVDVLRPTPKGIFPLNFLLVFVFFCASLFSFHLVFVRLCHPFCIDFWAHQPHYINRKYRSWVPTHMMSM